MKRFIVKPATGNMLEDLLNDMDSEGYDPLKISFNGAQQMENRLAPGQKTIMPMFTVIFESRMKIVDA